MPFEKVETSVDFPSLERAILKFWDDNGIFEKRKQLNANNKPDAQARGDGEPLLARRAGKDDGEPLLARRAGKKWSFLDGPITANNPMGVHHAWGRTYKDVYNRYFAMTGHELRYQNGFDCQGLWVEVEVEKELKLKNKRDIENLVPGDIFASIDRFVQACKARVDKFARVQTDQSIRLGYWMNWDRTDADWAKRPDERKSYFTMSEENNYTIWSFLKKCHCKGLIQRGYDVMPWCGRCGVGISEQEMKEGYKWVEHRACFVKLPLKNRPGENLLVWTTTPWTLTSNVGAAVNPELPYLKVKLKGEVYYVAKGAFTLNRMETRGEGGDEEDESVTERTGTISGSRTGLYSGTGARVRKYREWLEGVPHLVSIEQHFKSKAGKGETYEIVGEVKGAEMLGWEYVGPFDDLDAQNTEYGFPEEVAKITQQSGKWPARTAAQSHKVIDGGKDVTADEGTGIVHTAPGCGAIDYVWGRENGLPPVAPIGDDGVFVKGFGPLTGLNAADPATADAVFEQLRAKDRLFATERYVHRYPHCWRCKTELLYRLVDEWFIDMGPKGVRVEGEWTYPRDEKGSFRSEIAEVVRKVEFLPKEISGQARELDWLGNMGNWMISKKRYWGLALPIWVNDTDPTDFEVIGSREELKSRAVEGWQEFDGHTPHRPWIDKVKIESKKKPGQRMSRIPDVGNPWLDAGIVAFSTMKYNTDRRYWEAWYPADFITESFPGQFRNWFYALLAMSTMMTLDEKDASGKPLPLEKRRPFEVLLGFATMLDQFGKPMHKSDGNAIEFNSAAGDETNEGYELFHDVDPKQTAEAALKELPRGYVSHRDELTTNKEGKPVRRVYARYRPISADVMRWLYCRHNPSANLLFGPGPADEVRSKVFFKLWNTYFMFCNYATGDGFDPSMPPVQLRERQDVDRWLLSKLQELVTAAREAYEKYDVMTFALACEEFIEADLSNWYVRRNKDRLQSKVADLKPNELKDKWAAYQTLYTTLTTLCKLMAPCVPFVTEEMWRNLRRPSDPESVHLSDFPAADKDLIDKGLTDDMDEVRSVITLGLSARDAAKLNVKQALAELVVSPASNAERKAVERFPDLIRDELNVKAVRLHTGSTPLLTVSAKLNKKTAAAKLGPKLREAEEALARMTAGELDAKPFALAGVALDAADVVREYTAANGWKGVAAEGTQVAIDTTITEELKLEGLARSVIRQVQSARKDAKLDLLDKIELHLRTDAPELAKAIATHRQAIATAVQATKWSEAPLAGEFFTPEKPVKIDGQALAVMLRKV